MIRLYSQQDREKNHCHPIESSTTGPVGEKEKSFGRLELRRRLEYHPSLFFSLF